MKIYLLSYYWFGSARARFVELELLQACITRCVINNHQLTCVVIKRGGETTNEATLAYRNDLYSLAFRLFAPHLYNFMLRYRHSLGSRSQMRLSSSTEKQFSTGQIWLGRSMRRSPPGGSSWSTCSLIRQVFFFVLGGKERCCLCYYTEITLDN